MGSQYDRDLWAAAERWQWEQAAEEAARFLREEVAAREADEDGGDDDEDAPQGQGEESGR